MDEDGSSSDANRVNYSKHPIIEVHPGCDAVVLFEPSLTFECVDSCTWCCHHGVMLYEHDFQALANVANLSESTVQLRSTDFVSREQKDRSDHVADDGMACHFLDDEGLCSLQTNHDWKPTRCSVFPLSVERSGSKLIIDIRKAATGHCEGLTVGDEKLIDHLDAFLPRALWEIENPNSEILI